MCDMFKGCELPFRLGGIVWEWMEEFIHMASKSQCIISKAMTSSLTVFHMIVMGILYDQLLFMKLLFLTYL